MIATIPLLGGIVAVTYDVGYFWGVDPSFFGLFSLSEHRFCSSAVPAAILGVVIVLALVSWLSGEPWFSRDSASHKKQGEHLKLTASRVDRFFFWFFIIAIPLNLLLANYETCAFLLLTVTLVWGGKSLSSASAALAFGALETLFLAFVIGAAVPRLQMRLTEPTHAVELKQRGELQGRVLRAGEKGLLLFNISSSRAQFIKSDEVRSIRRLPPSTYRSLVCRVFACKDP